MDSNKTQIKTRQNNSREIKLYMGLNLEYYKQKCQNEKLASKLEKIAEGL